MSAGRSAGPSACSPPRPARPELAVAVRRRDDPVGRQGAFLSAAAVHGPVARPRRAAVLGAFRLLRLAADRRPAIADLLATLPDPRPYRCRSRIPGGGRGRPRHARPRRPSPSSCTFATADGTPPGRSWPRWPSPSAAPPGAFSMSGRSSASSTCRSPLMARALERRSLAYGLAAGLVAGCMAAGRDQVAYLGILILAGFVLAWWVDGDDRRGRLRAGVLPVAAACCRCVAGPCRRQLTLLLAEDLEPAGHRLRRRRTRLAASRAAAHRLRAQPVRGGGASREPLGTAEPPLGTVDLFLARNMGQLYPPCRSRH